MRSYGGFSDRAGLGGPKVDEAGAVPPDSNLPVTVLLNITLDDARKGAIEVADTSMTGVTAWLPRKLITIEPGARGTARRITMPLWLAREKNLATDTPVGQGELF